MSSDQTALLVGFLWFELFENINWFLSGIRNKAKRVKRK